MSDTDDTDTLLFIQPGLFIESVERDLELNSVQTQVVGGLIDQVSDLENRISFIESINSSCGNNSFIEIKSNYSMVLNDCDTSGCTSIGNEEVVIAEDLVSPACVLSTCEINSNTESCLDLNLSDNGRPKSKEALLKEIDVYLNNISSKNSREEGRSLRTSDSSTDSGVGKVTHTAMAEDVSLRSSFKRLDLPEVDRLLKEMENTQLEIENKLRMREVEYGLGQKGYANVSFRKSFPPAEFSNSPPERTSAPFLNYTSPLKIHDLENPRAHDDFAAKKESFLIGSSHNSDSDDTRKNGIRDLKTSASFDSKKQFVSPRRKLFQPDTLPLRKPTYGQSSSSIGPTFSRADLYKRDFFSRAGGDNAQSPPSRVDDSNSHRGKQNLKYNRNDHLSLAELWKTDKDSSEYDAKKLRQKLEEEKFRRIHLEDTIQDLQKRVLEEQEKLAVAVKVDEGKDKAIAQITEAWKQMVNHWREIEADRHTMSQAIIKERANMKQKEDDLNKKVERWEKEVSQALDLAAGYKNKYELLESEFSSTIETNNQKTKDFDKKLNTLEEELQQLYEERKILTDKLNVTQEEHDKEKQLVELAQKELSSLQELLKNTEAELTVMKDQRDLLSTRLREEKGKNSIVEQQKTNLQESLDEAKLRMNELEEALKNSTANFEKTRADLRGVYQKQLEMVVKEKLDEFQRQLNKSEAAMKSELTEARRLAQERAVAQQQSLVNSHTKEVRRLEAMYKEEIRTLENKLADSERRRDKLESGKKDIAHRLHGVMEAQWQQALSIITSEVSMRQGELETGTNRIAEPIENKMPKVDSLDLDSTFGEPPYLKEVPNASRRQSHKQQDTLLKYIQMLLDRQPGKPIDSASSGIWPDVTPCETFDESLGENKWNQIISNTPGLPSHPVQDTLKPLPPNLKKQPPWK